MQKSSFSFNFGSVTLSCVKQYKYLVLTLDEHLTFKEATDILSDSAGRALGSVLSKVKTCRDLEFYSFTQLYKSCVRPVSGYAVGVWGFNEQVKSNTVQYRAMGSFLGVHKLLPVLAICGDTGREPPNIRLKSEMLRLWNRLINIPELRLTRKILTGKHLMYNPGLGR